MAKKRSATRRKSEAKRRNPMGDKPLESLLVRRVDGLVLAGLGFPRWAMTKCKKLGVVTIADLYTLIYLRPSQSGVGITFVNVAQKALSDLGLNDRVGLADPITAAANEARAQAFRESNDMLPGRLEEHSDQMRKTCDARLALLEELHQLKVDKILAGFRRREGILKATLKEVTRQEMSFTADGVSPESAGRWLALHGAGKVPDGFAIKADLLYLARSGLPFTADMTLGLVSTSVAKTLVAHSQRSEEMVEAKGRFCIDFPSKRVEVAEAAIQVWFVNQGAARLARLEGKITIHGMSDADIKKLFIPTDPADVSDDAFAHERED